MTEYGIGGRTAISVLARIAGFGRKPS